MGVNIQEKLGETALLRWGFVSEEGIYAGKYWGLVTNAFVHFEIIHLVFNLYWLWIFGGAFEKRFGILRTVIFFLISAFVSSGLQLFEGPGVGLSGVGYALFGFAWVGRRRFPEFARVVNDRTVQMFVLWGIGCIFFTYAGGAKIGNVAHVSGALFGAATAGLVLLPQLRLALTAAVVVLSCGSAGAVFWNPLSGAWVESQVKKAEARQDYNRVVQLYRGIVWKEPAWAWEGIARMSAFQGKREEYAEALSELRRLDSRAADDIVTVFGDPSKGSWPPPEEEPISPARPK